MKRIACVMIMLGLAGNIFIFSGHSKATAGYAQTVNDGQSAKPIDDKNPPPPEDKKTQTVYVTKTGKRYHKSGCRFLSNSKIQMTREEAEKKSYTPCKTCKP
jgi:hypothetical protein